MAPVIRVVARGSRLSIVQVIAFASRISEVFPGAVIEARSVKTMGDRFADTPLQSIGGRGVFEKEVNLVLLGGEADMAIHSLKDVPRAIDPRLSLAAVLPRDPPYDVIVARTRVDSIDDLPRGAVVGTSSARRRAMLLHYRRDLRIRPVRGNVDTRLRKLRSGDYDALVLAEAGLVRLGLDLEYARIPPSIVMPAPCQGIIAVFVRSSDRRSARIASRINDDATMLAARAERAFLKAAGGGCHKPLGCLAEMRGGRLVLRASLLDPEGYWRRDVVVEGSPGDPEALGLEAAEKLGEKPWRRPRAEARYT